MAHQLPQLEDLGSLKDKKVLLRSDLNVPMLGGIIQDEHRIQNSLPTIKYLLEAGAKVSVCSHLGRPPVEDLQSAAQSGDKAMEDFSLKPVQKRLEELLDNAGGQSWVENIEVLENLRLNRGETTCNEDFIQKLIQDKDAYVNDAFGSSHRAHASIVGPPKYLPSAAGMLLQKEVRILDELLENAKRPLVVVMGGAKVSDKLQVIESLLEIADALAIGGAMAFSFLAAKGAQITELVEEDQVERLAQLLNSDLGKKIQLPEDLTALQPDAGDSSQGEVRQIGINVPDGWRPMDIGPGTAAVFCELIETAGSVFWNGPVGVFEDLRFAAGTKAIADAMASSSAFTIVGGGDSAAAIRSFGMEKDMGHLSTGGGATLKYLEKGTLPGISALIG